MVKIRLTSMIEDDEPPRRNDLVLRYVCLVALFVSRLFVMSVIVYNMVYETSEKQTCQCAVLPAFTYLSEADAETTIVDTIASVQCDAQGAKRCEAVCSWMVQMSPAVYWKKRCANEKNYREYRAFVYYRPCSDSDWYPGKRLKMTVYCIDGKAYGHPLNGEAPLEISTRRTDNNGEDFEILQEIAPKIGLRISFEKTKYMDSENTDSTCKIENIFERLRD